MIKTQLRIRMSVLKEELIKSNENGIWPDSRVTSMCGSDDSPFLLSLAHRALPGTGAMQKIQKRLEWRIERQQKSEASKKNGNPNLREIQ